MAFCDKAFGGIKVSSFKTKKRLATAKDDWIIVENTHEPIIQAEVWDSVQKRLAKAIQSPAGNGIRRNSSNEISLFSGIIKCADCGAAMAFNRRVRKNGAERHIYRCSRHANSGSHACTAHTIDAEVLEHVL
ncbi:MAG: recombinase family protein, partial [Dehalococcoidia bacterium]|nr:recombinase family protein [Dehalococcoidia bacterium]